MASAAGYTRNSKGDSAKTDTIGYQNLVDATKEAGIPRFVLISILESDKAVNVPHFHNKYLTEKYLIEKQQPYLPKRFKLNAKLNQPDRATMFGGGKKGYTDYPFLVV